MHFNLARINKTIGICTELFFRTIVATSCWELSNIECPAISSRQFEYERDQSFLLTL